MTSSSTDTEDCEQVIRYQSIASIPAPPIVDEERSLSEPFNTVSSFLQRAAEALALRGDDDEPTVPRRRHHDPERTPVMPSRCEGPGAPATHDDRPPTTGRDDEAPFGLVTLKEPVAPDAKDPLAASSLQPTPPEPWRIRRSASHPPVVLEPSSRRRDYEARPTWFPIAAMAAGLMSVAAALGIGYDLGAGGEPRGDGMRASAVMQAPLTAPSSPPSGVSPAADPQTTLSSEAPIPVVAIESLPTARALHAPPPAPWVPAAPTRSELTCRVADAAFEARQFDAALVGYESAVAENSSYLPARLGIARTMWALGRRHDAVLAYRAIAAEFPASLVPDEARAHVLFDEDTL